MRLQMRVRSFTIAIAAFAGLLGAAAAIERRSESFKRLAAFHLQASSILMDGAGERLFCVTGLSEADLERIFCSRGPNECCAYKASRYHNELSEKYEFAAKHPWLPVSDDPPPLPGTFPEFKVDSIYYEMLYERGTAARIK
jgi:hypothetical protein